MTKITTHLKQNFCARPESLRENLAGIFRKDGKIVATNGHILAEIDTKIYPALSDAGGERSDFPNYETMLTPRYLSSADSVIPVEDLRTPEDQIKDRTPEEIPCIDCNGERGCKHECDCPYCTEDWERCKTCSGTGYKLVGEYFYTYIKIGHQTFRASYISHIARLLEMLSADNIRSNQSGTRALVLHAKGIRCLCMPVILCDKKPDSPWEIIRHILPGNADRHPMNLKP